jgi:uncharacterized protein (TIGR03118 family)
MYAASHHQPVGEGHSQVAAHSEAPRDPITDTYGSDEHALRCLGAWLLVLLMSLLQLATAGCGGSDSGSAASMVVRETKFVSDISGQAAVMDPDLVNAWGIAASPTGPFWIADNGQGVSTLYDGSGHPFPASQPLVVTVPPPDGSPDGTTAAPTGVVFNGTNDFVITQGTQSGPSLFIFATEDGTLSGWSPNVNATAAVLTADNSGSGAVYKGLALGNSSAAGNLLYATNFHAGRIDVFDRNFAPANLAGAFADPNIPAGFAPFGIANIQGGLYVTYAKQDEDQHDDVKGPGNGFVDVFDADGNLVRRFASQGPLNSPWGVVLAPATFGSLGNTILVGNFGDGHISAFDRASGSFLGQLSDGQNLVEIDGLWGLSFGNGAAAGDVNTLFFTAGPNDEQDGLFGALQPVMGGM